MSKNMFSDAKEHSQNTFLLIGKYLAVNKDMLKVNYTNGTRCKLCSKFTIKKANRSTSVHVFLLSLLALNISHTLF